MTDIWTLSGPATGTLTALGFEGATLSFRGQAPDELVLSATDPNHAAAAWARGTAVTLRRNGATVFSGKVARDPRSGAPARDGRQIVIRGPWDDLDRLPYAQAWSSWNGSAVIRTADHPRVSLGTADSGGRWTDTKAALEQLLAYARTKGVNLRVGSLPPARRVPVIEGHARMVGELVRQVLRWHADCLVWVDYSGATPALHVRPVTTADAGTVLLDGLEETAYEFVQSEEVARNVVIRWEALVDSWAGREDTSGLDPAERYRVQIATDSAGGSTVGVDTVLAVMPVQIPGVGAPQVEKQEIGSRRIPENGATNDEAELFWIRHTAAERWGLVPGQVKLPAVTEGDIYAHQVRPVPLPTEEELGGVRPPTFWTDTASKLSRELLYGQIQPWMGRSFGHVTCRATVGIAQSAIDELPAEAQAEALRMCRPETREIGGVQARLLDAEVTIGATNALSRVYYAVSPGTPDGSVPPVSEQIIAGLAATYFDAIKEPRWEGNLALTAAEAGAVRWSGRVVNATGGRSAWTGMRAPVAAEVWQIETGTVRLTLGAPAHLHLADYVELARVARLPMTKAEAGGQARYDDPGDATLRGRGLPRSGAVSGPSQTRGLVPHAQQDRRWALRSVGENGYTIRLGKVWDGEEEVQIEVDGTATEYVPAAGGAFYLEQDGMPEVSDDWNLTLKAGEKPAALWTYDATEEEMKFARKILVTFHGEDVGGGAVGLGNSIWTRVEVADADLEAIGSGAWDAADNRFFAVLKLVPL